MGTRALWGAGEGTGGQGHPWVLGGGGGGKKGDRGHPWVLSPASSSPKDGDVELQDEEDVAEGPPPEARRRELELLKREGELPLEELLGSLPPQVTPPHPAPHFGDVPHLGHPPPSTHPSVLCVSPHPVPGAAAEEQAALGTPRGGRGVCGRGGGR